MHVNTWIYTYEHTWIIPSVQKVKLVASCIVSRVLGGQSSNTMVLFNSIIEIESSPKVEPK